MTVLMTSEQRPEFVANFEIQDLERMEKLTRQQIQFYLTDGVVLKITVEKQPLIVRAIPHLLPGSCRHAEEKNKKVR